MRTFSLEPMVGALPLTFDMSASEVATALGAPTSETNMKNGRIDRRYGGCSVKFSRAGLVDEMAFMRPERLLIDGANWLTNRAALKKQKLLLKPAERLGFTVFLDLGLALELEQQVAVVFGHALAPTWQKLMGR